MAKRKKKIDYKNTGFLKLLFLGMFGKDPEASTSEILISWGIFLWLSFFAIGIPFAIVYNGMQFFDWLDGEPVASEQWERKKIPYRELENQTMKKLSQIYPNGVKLFCGGTSLDGGTLDYTISLNFKSDIGDVRVGDLNYSRSKSVFGPEKKVSRTISAGKMWTSEAEVLDEMLKGNWIARWTVNFFPSMGSDTLIFEYQEDPNTYETNLNYGTWNLKQITFSLRIKDLLVCIENNYSNA